MAKRRAAGDDEDRFRKLRRLALTAIFSDAEFLRDFALKGGGALDLAYGISARASVDLDISMRGALANGIAAAQGRFESLLVRRFGDEKLHVFDVCFVEQPKEVSEDLADFWGGYLLTCKFIEPAKAEALGWDVPKMRVNAMPVSSTGSPTLEVDISRHEFVDAAGRIEIDGYDVAVYEPMALLLEKLRAICQQMPDYGVIVKRGRPGAPRARDFYDIDAIRGRFPWLEPTSAEALRMLRAIFDAKRVPMALLARVGDAQTRAYHADDWQRVVATIADTANLGTFDHYFDRTAELSRRLCEALGIPHAPA